jgi:hypothetical protein
MKKLAIVALVLVALSFVGCGVPAELLGTWERDWGNGAQGESYEFKANKEVVYTYYINGETSSTATYDYVVDGDVVTLSLLGVEFRSWRYEVEGNVLKLYYTDDLFLEFTRK